MTRYRGIVTLFLFALLTFSIACNFAKSKTEPGNSTTKEDPARAGVAFSPSSDARKDLRDAMGRLNSAYPYRLTETMSALGDGANTIPGGTRVVEFEAADRLHMKWTGGLGGDVEAVTIGDKHYWYSEGKWTEGGVKQRADPGLDLSKKFADMVKDVKYVGPETINGIACHTYTCTFDGPMAGQSWSGTSKVWIRAADGLPHQSDSDIKFSGYGGKSHIVYEYGGNIKVEPPAM
jgi:hypothetical protein